jgi:D-alanyl-D-alanine endopeptidase (penicillin-binding protein 7)
VRARQSPRDSWRVVEAAAATGDGEATFISDGALSQLGGGEEALQEEHAVLAKIFPFLEGKRLLTPKQVTVRTEELAGAGHTQLRRGEVVPLGELLHMSLMCSDNCATRVVALESGLAPDDFIARMNTKSIELGLTGTRFVEFTGLNEHNVSTAADVARLLHAAANEPLIAEITTTRSYEFHTARRWHTVGNTNRLLYGRYEILGGKTGFIHEAGYCFATWVRAQGRDLIAVVLGAPTNATRFADAVRLIQKVPAAPTTSATTTSQQ